MLETSYTDAEKLANDIVQTLVNNGFDEAGKSMSLGAGPSAVKIGSSTIKLIESAGGSITINEDSLDWKMLDPEIKNLIHGVATASGENPQMGSQNDYLDETPDSELRMEDKETNVDNLIEIEGDFRKHISVYRVGRESATGSLSTYGIVDTTTGFFDANITTAIDEDEYLRYLVIMDDASQISFYNDSGVLHADDIYVEKGDEEVFRGVFMLGILMEYADYLGLTKISGEMSSSTVAFEMIDKAGIDQNEMEVDSRRVYFETDAF